jgi:hypothetical protein
MSKILSQLLDAKEPMFTMALNQLEQVSGQPAADVRLISEISQTVRSKTNELGLDPNDTTEKELYHGLQSLVQLHNSYLAKAIGSDSNDPLDKQLTCIYKTLQKLPISKSCWVIKHSSIKRLLKTIPPKKVMKQLGYKSIDSMLKRERMSEICTAIRFMETRSWQDRFVKSYKKLSPSDFEIRDIEILYLDNKKWKNSADDFIYAQRHNITHLKELGVIMILPIPVKKLKGVVITVLPLALHYINEIRSYSAFFKLQQVRFDFGEILVRTILEDPNVTAKIAGQPLHWRIIQRHFGSSKNKIQPDTFEPHVQIDDLFWRKAEDILYRIEPALKFWENLDYVATINSDNPVSLSLMDNAVSYCNGLEFGQQATGHFRESLWNELYMRYMGYETIEDEVLHQLNKQVLTSESIEG